ncbi:MAG TPA: PilN domain-containing protein [Solirubrobacterales bacterium]|jgi:Tfp pilus assembly protein PilN|nr:PilN domain-containing protein [Solirubrobacterales bacterium]
MRPVNLIPVEERRGQNAPLRSGPIAYVVLGVLVAVLLGVVLLVLTGNEITDSKSELAQVQREDAEASAKAERLAAYSQYRALSEQRVATVKSLADSRFDWERVMRELSLILPPDVWLTQLSATASPNASVEGGAGESAAAGLRGAIAGPALEMSGCADRQAGVAGFVTALRDIDGVTRVGVESSALPPTGTAAGTGEGGEGSTNCRTRDFIAEFKIVVAFDAAPVPPAEGEAAVAPAPEAPTEEEAPEETATSSEG